MHVTEKANLFDMLKEMMGHVNDSTDVTVRLAQDDATNNYLVKVGNKLYHGASLSDAIRAAYSDFNPTHYIPL